MPFDALQSPRSQEFLNQPSPDDEEALFTQGFTDLAYRALEKSVPTLRPSVVTFRTLEKDITNGEAVGAFIVRYGTEVIYVPVILVDNAVKPLDVFYARTQDRFYPLTPQWLDRVDRETVNPMGRAMEPPKNLPTDVDLRNLVIPPTLGRFSYAEEGTKLAFMRVMRELGDFGGSFLDCVRAAPSMHKRAMAEGLQRQPRVLSLLVEQYGVSAMRDAFVAREKVASAEETSMRRDVRLYSASMPVQEMMRELGPQESAMAYSAIRRDGFYVQDTRQSVNALRATGAERLTLSTPTSTGLYRVYLTDGSCKTVAVIVDPVEVGCQPMPYEQTPRGVRPPTRLLVLFQDGRFAEPDRLLAEVLPVTQGEFESFFIPRARAFPTNRERGVVGHFFAMGAKVTGVLSAYDTQRGDKTSTFYSGGETITRTDASIGEFKTHPGGLLYGRDSFWWPVTDYVASRDLLSDLTVISTMIDAQLVKEGAVRVKVKMAAEGGFIIGREVLHGPAATVKIASEYNLSLEDATTVMVSTRAHTPYAFWSKVAADPAAAPPPGDPNAMPMDPSMMAPPPPPMPTGMDLAITEKTQLIQQQIAALQQQQMMLQEVQMRAQGIDGSGGMMAAPQAALGMMGAPPATVGGAPALAPTGTMGQPMPQGQPGSALPQGMPQAPPTQPMFTQPGMPGTTPQPPQMISPGYSGVPMDPYMGGAYPPAPPPQPVMTEPPTAETIGNSIDPKFLQDAALLGDPRVFDAAAVAALAKPRALREIFRNYSPTLDAALDKLGRTLILLYTQARELRDRMGDEAYQLMEQRVRDTFRVMGDSLILMEEHTSHLPDGSRPTG